MPPYRLTYHIFRWKNMVRYPLETSHLPILSFSVIIASPNENHAGKMTWQNTK